MRTLIEVFRNTPVGRNCRTLSQNVAQVLQANVEKDLEVRFLPLDSPEAEARGVEIAPCLVVNGRNVVEGVPGPDEIARLIEEAVLITLGIILTRGPFSSGGAEDAVELAAAARESGDKVGLFLISDGVWLAHKGQEGPLAGRLAAFQKAGGEVLVSGEHLVAAGLSQESLVDDVTVLPEPYDELVDLVMERWDKAIIL
ncbi:MAG: DsrE family protein [Dehalococcoidia bacterium]|jgi:sulfur relay (sulfurtransferase) DsrF/TusC family protein|nr:DsrE family protein [Dehalococcoidia bacterium]MDP7240135.1 DsrE family protein [Dehalococcoidia bacterium]